MPSRLQKFVDQPQLYIPCQQDVLFYLDFNGFLPGQFVFLPFLKATVNLMESLLRTIKIDTCTLSEDGNCQANMYTGTIVKAIDITDSLAI